MSFSIIAAVDENNGIGKDNKIPWHISEDFKYFAKTTKITEDPDKQNAVIMGTNTWHSLPDVYKPLPGRLNIILNSQENLNIVENALIFKSFDEALKSLEANETIENIFIIGGAMLYKFAIDHPACSKVYITKIMEKFDCDTYFPEIPDKFKLTKESDINEEKGIKFKFLIYENK